MSRALRDLRTLLDRVTVNDSYGVDGSDFRVCLVCQHESGAGVLARPNWHAKDCPVPHLERKWQLPRSKPTRGVKGREEALRRAGAAGLDPDSDVVGDGVKVPGAGNADQA